MPQQTCRNGAPRTPRAGDAADAIEVRERAHPLHLAHRGHEREVAARPHVGASERHQQIDVGGPRPDALERDQRGTGLVVVELGETIGIEPALHDRDGQFTYVVALLFREARAPERGLIECGDALGCDLSGKALQPQVRGAPSRERDLLFEDDLHERLESRRPIPQGRRAVTCDDSGEVRIPAGELGHAVAKRLRRQLGHHISQTQGRTLL